MDSQTTHPAAPERSEPSTATLHNATIDKAERNEFINTAHDMFKIVLNYNHNSRSAAPTGAGQAVENPVSEFQDAINYLLNAVPLFVEEVRKNDQSRSAVGKTTSDLVTQATTIDHALHSTNLEHPVDVIDIVPPEPSSLPVANIADRYTRSMLKCLHGYALYNPKPFCELSKEYPRIGINVGDVGFVRGSGTFDFLFNICPSQNGFMNPSNLPKGFTLETSDDSETTILEPLPPNTRLFQSPITKTRSDEYICEGPEGAVLELPKGAIQDEAMNIRPFEKLAARHGVQWYEYTMTRGRSIPNGSLYLITSVTKCSQWGIAVFDRPCAPGQGLKFEKKRSLPFGKSTSKYRWNGSDTFSTKVCNPEQGDAANQCVFVRGYKIMIRQDIFDNLCNDQPRRSESAIPSSSPQAGSNTMTRQPATRIRGGAGPDPVSRLTGAGLFSRTTMTKSDEEGVLHPDFNSSLVHPSDLINAALLSQNPNAKIALTHDNVWCNLLRENFPKLDYAILIKIARSYSTTIEYDCVSLEKISDLSKILEQNSHPLLVTKILGLQGPLTSPAVDDYTPVPATFSLTLPHELVERILILLDTKSMLKCRLVSREFNAIIQSSTLVQYYLACKAAGVLDNPQSLLSYAERFDALKKREDAWRKLTPVFEMTIQLFDQPWMLYALSAGNYFLTDSNGKEMYYCPLPSSLQDNPQWLTIPGHGPGQSLSASIVGIGMAVHEHDLVHTVISSEVGSQAGIQRHSLDLVLLKFSTGEYHPLARHPLIHVQKSLSAKPYTSVDIVGDNLALVVHDQQGSQLFIFDWKTGHTRLQHKATENTYDCSIPVFVSSEILLVPNRILSHLEVWHLFPSHPNTPVQILSLQLPAISVNYSIIDIRCHGEPRPFLHSKPYSPQRPFFSSSENSIITINLLLRSLQVQCAYKLIMHTRALLSMIQKWTSPSFLEKEQLPIWSTNEVTVHKVADPDDGLVRLVAQSVPVTTMPHPGSSPRTRGSPTSPTLQISADSSSSSISAGSASSTSQYDILHVQWANWGPPISRWFQVNGTHPWCSDQSTGQRYVFLDPNPHDERKCTISVADFNPHNVRKDAEIMAQLRGEGEDNGGNDNNGQGGEEENETDLEILDHEGVFSEEVYMGLKCVIYHAPGEFDFDLVLMDEERLLGLKIGAGYIVESIKVLYFG